MSILTQIQTTYLCPTLRDDMGNIPEDEFSAYEYAFMTDDGFIDGNTLYQILWYEPAKRGGICYVGSGSDGQSYWTDAKNAEDVLFQYLTGTIYY